MSLRKTVSAFGILIGCALMAPLVAGCADDEKTEKEDGPVAGSDFARGILGVERGEQGEEAKAADAIVSEMDKQFPGRLAQIEADLASQNADRAVAAKRLLDETIDAVANGAAFGGDGRVGTSLIEANGIRPLGGLTNGGTSLVNGPGQLTCARPRDASGNPLVLGRGSNGRYGDDRTGALGAARDSGDYFTGNAAQALGVLAAIDRGEVQPPRDSRLGAYAATRGYPQGTVGRAVHNAIGTIYVSLGNYGQENIGRVFNSAEARALYNQPVASCAGYQMAMLEHAYWDAVRREDPSSPGGNLGSMFNPRARDLLQRNVFGG